MNHVAQVEKFLNEQVAAGRAQAMRSRAWHFARDHKLHGWFPSACLDTIFPDPTTRKAFSEARRSPEFDIQLDQIIARTRPLMREERRFA